MSLASIPNPDSILLKKVAKYCQASDSVSPFSDHVIFGDARVFYWLKATNAKTNTFSWKGISITGVAIVKNYEIEMVILPEYRRKGYSQTFIKELLAALQPPFTFWMHGSHPAALHLAKKYCALIKRKVMLMRLPGLADSYYPAGKPHHTDITYRHFTPGDQASSPTQDEKDWLAVNAKIFADHPTQGQITLDSLRKRYLENWFDPENFILATRDERLVGYAWLKIIPGRTVGEIYALGVSCPGLGIGRKILELALEKLRDQGLTSAELYVESNNVQALSLYRKLGFKEVNQDVLIEIKK